MATVTCNNCSEVLWSGTEGEEPDALVTPAAEERAPCSKCGARSRGFSRALSDEARVTAAVSAQVDRAINSDRLTMFTFVVAIGVGVMFAVGFAVDTAWPLAVLIAVASGLSSMVVTVLLTREALRNARRRHRLMAVMHWMTGR